MARRRKMTPERREFINGLLEHYQPTDAQDVQEMLKDLLGDTLQGMLEAEMDQKLGYSKYDYQNKETDDSRNGYSHKTVTSSMGDIDLDIPRDRRGEFEPQIVKKHQTDISNIEDQVLSMYAKGMTTRDISTHLSNVYIMNEIQEIKCAKEDPSFDEEIWINTVPTFYENQKEDLLLTDEGGIQWVALSKYADTGKGDLAYNKLLIWNWLYGYFVTDEQLVTLKKYADKKVNLINSDISWIPETYTIYNREYPWSSGSKSIEESQWENIKVETGEMKSIIEKVEEPQFSYAEILQKKYLGEFDEDKKWDELRTVLDDKISIPMVSKQYTREEPVTVELGRVLNSCQDLIWEEEFDASKEETISVSHPCAEIIKVLGLSQKKYDGYYCNKAGELIAFDTALTKQKAGLIIRKDALDEFLSIKNFHLVWFVNASKEIHNESLVIKKYTDWTGLLEYKGDFVEGDYYITEYR